MIKDSARRHAIQDADIEHALRHWLVAHDLVDDADRHVTLYVGPTFAGLLIEVGVNSAEDVIHAMPARRRYLPRTNERR
jgi:hypothetical protein